MKIELQALLLFGLALLVFGEDAAREEKLIAYYSTTSVTQISTTTKLKLSTCLSTTQGTTCNGRRRSLFGPEIKHLPEQEPGSLDSSQGTPQKDGFEEPVTEIFSEEEEAKQSGRLGRKFTLWSTAFTTLTVTTTSFYASTTITVSALCTYAGLAQTCFG